MGSDLIKILLNIILNYALYVTPDSITKRSLRRSWKLTRKQMEYGNVCDCYVNSRLKNKRQLYKEEIAFLKG